MDEKVIGILAAAAGVAATEVAELIKTAEGADTLADHFEAKLTKVKDDADKRATKKTRTDVERAFASAGVEGAQFADLSAAIAAVQEKAAAATGDKLTDEQALRHPAVVRALNAEKQQREQAVTAARAEEQQKLADKEKAFTKAQTDAQVRAQAAELEAKLNPNYTPGREAQQRKKLIDDIVAMGGYQLAEGGAIDIVDADGNLQLGKLKNPLKFDERVRDYAEELFGLPQSTERHSPGAKPGEVAPKVAYEGPKTQEEVDQKVAGMARETPAARAKVQTDFAAWQATQSS